MMGERRVMQAAPFYYFSLERELLADSATKSQLREPQGPKSAHPPSYLRGYLPVTVTQIHSGERAFKPVHASSQIPPAPVSCIPVNPRERP